MYEISLGYLFLEDLAGCVVALETLLNVHLLQYLGIL